MTDCDSPSKCRLPSEGLLQLSTSQPSSAAAATNNNNNNCHRKISKNHSQNTNNTSNHNSNNNNRSGSNSDGTGSYADSTSTISLDAIDQVHGACASNVVVVTADPNHAAVCKVVANNSKHLNVKCDGGAGTGSSGGTGHNKEMQQQRRWSEHRQLMVVIFVYIYHLFFVVITNWHL